MNNATTPGYKAIHEAQEFIVRKIGKSIPIDENGFGFKSFKSNDCGVLAFAIVDVDVQVTLKAFDYTETEGRRGHELIIKYSYNHPLGSNGYTTHLIAFDDNFDFKPW